MVESKEQDVKKDELTEQIRDLKLVRYKFLFLGTTESNLKWWGHGM